MTHGNIITFKDGWRVASLQCPPTLSGSGGKGLPLLCLLGRKSSSALAFHPKDKRGGGFLWTLASSYWGGCWVFWNCQNEYASDYGVPKTLSQPFFFKHIHFLPGPEPRCSGYVNPPVVTLLTRASRELLVLGKSCQFELCSRMCPEYFSLGEK